MLRSRFECLFSQPCCAVTLWDTATGARVLTLARQLHTVTAAAWMPDGRRFVTVGTDG
jgi:hypothetical protein